MYDYINFCLIQDLRIASIYGVFLIIISDIYTTISVFA